MVATRVQDIRAVDAGSATIAIGSGQGWGAPTSGNLLIAWYNGDNTCSTPSGFTAAPSVVDGNGVYVWWKVSAGTETTISFVQSASSDGTCGVLEYSGLTASPFDVQNAAATANGPPATSTNSASVTTTNSIGDLIFAIAGLHGVGAASAPTSPSWTGGYTTIGAAITNGTVNTSTYCHTFIADQQTASAGTVASVASWTNTINDRQQIVVAFKLAAGGGAPVTSGNAFFLRNAPRTTPLSLGLPTFRVPMMRGGSLPTLAASIKAVGTIVDAGTSAGSITLPVPATAVTGDYMVAVLYSSYGTSATDWDMGNTGFVRLGPTFNASSTAQRVGGMFGKLITGVPPYDVTWTTPFNDPAVRNVGVMLVLQDVNPSVPVDSSSAWTSSAAASNTISVPLAGTDGDLTLEFYESDYTSPNSYGGFTQDSGLTDIADLFSPAGAENTGISRTAVRILSGVAPAGGVPAHTISTTGSSSHRAVYSVSFAYALNTATPKLPFIGWGWGVNA